MADLLVGVRARSTAFCQAILEPPWGLRIADGAALALATTLRGHAWIVPDHGPPVLMRTGDEGGCPGIAQGYGTARSVRHDRVRRSVIRPVSRQGGSPEPMVYTSGTPEPMSHVRSGTESRPSTACES